MKRTSRTEAKCCVGISISEGMRECKPVLRILSVYEQLIRKETPEGQGLDTPKKLASIRVFQDVRVLLLKQPNDIKETRHPFHAPVYQLRYKLFSQQ